METTGSKTCPPEGLLEAAAERRLATGWSWVTEHVGHCVHCAARVSRLQADAEDTGDIAPPGALPAASAQKAPALAPGTQVGRYLVLNVLGEGGMGVVYAAYDPQLQRRVAVKLLHDQGEGSTGAETRLLREAQALAQLSHPHVVSVFDVGVFEGGVFIAMELIDGQSLSAWLKQEPRHWREVVQVFLAAGRGLAAAHATGLIHRDFKPDNVLLRKDGHVFVTDFGLARSAKHAEAEGPPPNMPLDIAEEISGDSYLRRDVTLVGQVVGTLAYLAPEQLQKGTSDALSDQFAFAVSLFEALHGKRPFAALARSAEERWKLLEPPRKVQIPAHLRAVVMRGLSLDPLQRYASMDALLQDLAHDPRARRRTWALAAAAVLVLVGAFIALRRPEAARLCTGAPARLAGVWDGQSKGAVATAFTATGRADAADLFTRTSGALDQYAQGWIAEHTEACVATRVRGEQSDEALSLRMACLEQRRTELQALVEVFGHADAQVAMDAARAVRSLTPLASCGNIEVLRSRVKPPRDAQTAARVAALRDQAARTKALLNAGRFTDALPQARSLAEAATALHYRPVEAELWLLLAMVQDKLGEPQGAEAAYRSAALAAQAGGSPLLAAEASTRIVRSLAMLNRDEASRLSAAQAAALVEGLGGDALLESNLYDVLSVADYVAGRYREALANSERAVALRVKKGDVHSPEYAWVNYHLATMLQMNGLLARAAEVDQANIALYRQLYGPEHIEVGNVSHNLGEDFLLDGRFDAALPAFETAMRIRLATLGPHTLHAAQSEYRLATVLMHHGRYEEALALSQRAHEAFRVAGLLDGMDANEFFLTHAQAHENLGRFAEALSWYARSVDVSEKTRGPDHPVTALSLQELSRGLRAAGQTARALAPIERALAIATRAYGEGHPMTAEPLQELAEVTLALGQLDRADAAASRAVEILARTQSKDSAILGAALSTQGRVLLARGAGAAALPLLEQSLALAAAQKISADRTARTRFALARAVFAAAPARGFELAAQARVQASPTREPRLGGEISRWMEAAAGAPRLPTRPAAPAGGGPQR